MACEICEHCQSRVSRDDVIMMREGFSYHKRCHKCYVCSETNLQNAEVFKGVIFCSRCAQRIFQGCSTARRTKNMHANRGRRPRSKSHRRDREKPRCQDWKPDRSRDGVIELARLAASNATDSDEPTEQKMRRSSIVAISDHIMQVEKNKRVENCFYYQTVDRIKPETPEMGTTTDVTQELLQKIITLVDDRSRPRTVPTLPIVPQRRKRYKKRKGIPIKKKPSCSDPRIAELGISTEIANMALRKNSEVPVTIQSDTRFKGNTSYTVSVLNLKSDRSGEGEDWVDSAYSTIEESQSSNVMDKRLTSILKIPLQLFKKKILTRSSLVSVLMSSETGSMNMMQKLKHILHEEVLDHRVRGLRRLYSTINRRKIPYKLGWVHLVSQASKLQLAPLTSREESSEYEKRRCKHFRHSHSYRCMRAQVMRLAGPTTSELAVYRHKIKRFIAPKFLRNMIAINYPAVKLSAACQRSTVTNSKKSSKHVRQC